jgi:hypothetical protein
MFFYFLVSSLGAWFLYYNKDYCKELLIKGLWNTTRKYHEYSIYLEELTTSSNLHQESLIELVDKEFLYVKQYNINAKTQLCYNIEDYENLEGTLDFLVKNDLYKTIEKSSSLKSEDLLKEDFDKADNIFISVEINLNSKSIDITKDIKPFYIINNTILDKTFVEWFLKTEKHIDLNNEEYVISLIDNNVNMLELRNDQYIIIKNATDYSIEKTN